MIYSWSTLSLNLNWLTQSMKFSWLMNQQLPTPLVQITDVRRTWLFSTISSSPKISFKPTKYKRSFCGRGGILRLIKVPAGSVP